MRCNGSARSLRRTFLGIIILCLCSSGASCAEQDSSDPVEALRETITAPEEAKVREHQLTQRINALKGLPEMARALSLRQWVASDEPAEVQRVNAAVWNSLAQRFEQELRRRFQTANETDRAALIGFIRATSRDFEHEKKIQFDRLIIRVVGEWYNQATQPSVRRAIADALSDMIPDDKPLLSSSTTA